MEGILTLKEVEGAYQVIKDGGLTKGLYYIVSIIAVVVTIRKILKEYWDGLVDNKSKPIDMTIYFNLLKPLIPYVLIITALPFVVSLFESLFSLMEQNFLSKVGSSPTVDFELYIKKEEQLYNIRPRATNMMGLPSWTTMMRDFSDYIRINVIAPMMLMIDNYMYSFALSGRYIYLLLLEMVAPLAIIGLLYKSTENMFFSWVKNMMICYLLIPGFMLANFFADKLFSILISNNQMGILMMLFLIALKLYLYKKVVEFTPRLIS